MSKGRPGSHTRFTVTAPRSQKETTSAARGASVIRRPGEPPPPCPLQSSSLQNARLCVHGPGHFDHGESLSGLLRFHHTLAMQIRGKTGRGRPPAVIVEIAMYILLGPCPLRILSGLFTLSPDVPHAKTLIYFCRSPVTPRKLFIGRPLV